MMHQGSDAQFHQARRAMLGILFGSKVADALSLRRLSVCHTGS